MDNTSVCSEIEIGERKVEDISKPEPPDHPPLQISVERQDSVHWISSAKKFQVVRLEFKERTNDAKQDCDAPEHPFYRKFPDDNNGNASQVDSGPARPEAIGLIYKAHFRFEDGEMYDPHIQIGK